MNTIREIAQINQQELDRGIAGTSASWHEQYAHSAWCYVGNLHHQLSEGDVVCIMSQFGEIEDIHLVRQDADTRGGRENAGVKGGGGDDDGGGGGAGTNGKGKSRGFAFVKYEDARSCVLAVDNLVGVQVLGRPIRVDHVERYRLPKKLQEQEEENDSRRLFSMGGGGPGHAYKDVELANQYNVHSGVDLFAPVAQTEEYEGSSRIGIGDHGHNGNDVEWKQRRKEERRRRREEGAQSALKRLKRDSKRKKKSDRAHRKQRHDDDDDDCDSDSGNDNGISDRRNNNDEMGDEKKRKHRKEKRHRRHRHRHSDRDADRDLSRRDSQKGKSSGSSDGSRG